MRNLKLLKTQQGFGLVEVIVGLGIAIIVITSLVSLAIFTLRSSLQSNLLLQGSKLANEELEAARALRDQSATWADFKAAMDGCLAPTKCSINTSTWEVANVEEVLNSGTVRQLNRYFQASYPVVGNTNIIRISVSVSWNIGGQIKYAHVYSDLSNWRGN